MTECPQFSIVIPMFNVEKYIETTNDPKIYDPN
ncbi:MAG: glycosyltransferase [Selenomonadaceae bacterium]|nr:glycosyltransferase [Selenomonadaceae bacterium]